MVQPYPPGLDHGMAGRVMGRYKQLSPGRAVVDTKAAYSRLPSAVFPDTQRQDS